MNTPERYATLQEAHARWTSHTKAVLSDYARALAKRKTVWTTRADGLHVVTLGDALSIAFLMSEYGHPYACTLSDVATAKA